MRAAERLQLLAKRLLIGSSPAGSSNNGSYGNHGSVLLYRRSPKATLAGAFILAVGLSGAGAYAVQSFGDGTPPKSNLSNNSASDPAASSDEPSQINSEATDSSGSAEAAKQANSNVDVSTSVTSNGSNGESTTSVTVNGKSISVPANGSVHKTLNQGNQKTDVSIHQTTTGEATNQNSVNINSNSSTIDSEDSYVSSD